MEEKRSVPLFHPRQTFFRQNRFLHITRFPASKLTSPYVRQASLLVDYETFDQILIFSVRKAERVTRHAAGNAHGANGGSCIGRLPYPK